MEKKLQELKKEYMEIPIPANLTFVVEQALKKKKKKSFQYKWVMGVAASVIVFVGGLNTSPAFANALLEVPVVSGIVKVLTIKEYKVEKDTLQADIKVPAVTNLQSNTLENSLNKSYLEDSKALYDKFTAEMGDIEKEGGGHLSVNSGFEVKTDNENIFAIGRYVEESRSSTYETVKYDTIDKKNKLLLSLPILFKDDRYINILSENIKEQMKTQMKTDSSKIYWVRDVGLEEPIDFFETIDENQHFYINKDGKLLISFDEYEVAPGYMGVVEFEIPTEVISDQLVGNKYIY